jgi:hypothetical protein
MQSICRYCPECINKDTQLIVGRGKPVKEGKPSTKRSSINVRDTECIIGKYNDSYE